MKPPSYLTAVSQPHPHRTSIHSHMQSTAYHYNSILNAKSQINTSKPNHKICLNILNNKHTKNLNKQRKSQNQKLLKSLIQIQQNYSLYGTKNLSQLQKSHEKHKTFNTITKRRKSLNQTSSTRLDPLSTTKTLKNPFIQKMQRLKISQQNLKLFEKISTMQSRIANKRQMREWNNKIMYWGSFLQSTNREKQSSQLLKSQFFNTFVKMRQSVPINNVQRKSNTIRLQPKCLINPEMRTLSHSKRMMANNVDNNIENHDDVDNKNNQIAPLKQSFRIKHKNKKRHRTTLRRIQTQQIQTPNNNNKHQQQIKLHTESY